MVLLESIYKYIAKTINKISPKFVERKDTSSVKDIDKTIKNKSN